MAGRRPRMTRAHDRQNTLPQRRCTSCTEDPGRRTWPQASSRRATARADAHPRQRRQRRRPALAPPRSPWSPPLVGSTPSPPPPTRSRQRGLAQGESARRHPWGLAQGESARGGGGGGGGALPADETRESSGDGFGGGGEGSGRTRHPRGEHAGSARRRALTKWEPSFRLRRRRSA